MKKIKDNIQYIISQDDNDATKLDKIFKKMNELGITLSSNNYKIREFKEGNVIGEINFTLESQNEKEEVTLPFVLESSKFNNDIYEIIFKFKKIIIFEKLGIVPNFDKIENAGTTASQKQIGFIKDKMKYNDSKIIVEAKLKELNKTLDKLSKDEASAIITALGRR